MTPCAGVPCVVIEVLLKIAIAAASILLSLAVGVAAQPASPPLAAAPEPPVRAGAPLSEDVALSLSIGGTVASWGLLIGSVYLADRSTGAAVLSGTAGVAGVVIAPSLGHRYAGKLFTRGMKARLIGGLTAVVGLAVIVAQSNIFEGDPADHPVGDSTAGKLIALAGAGLIVAGTIDDVITAPRRVRRHNRGLRDVAVAPLAASGAAGLAVGGRF
jgi:hypothetical protein